MANPYFQFKQFTVWHDRCAMKVGTDGVLLGAWASIDHSQQILDVGTGSGLVALMLAQRSSEEVSITGIEIDQEAAKQARENAHKSPWKEKINIVCDDFTTHTFDRKFDLIVSNPPYFKNSLKCPDNQRAAARHDDSLSYETLFARVKDLLADKGTFTLIIPIEVEDLIKEIAHHNELTEVAQLYVTTKPDGAPRRTLISFSTEKREYSPEILLTEKARHQYSDEYIRLTRAFYLNME